MDSLKDIFLKDIAKQIFPGNAPLERMYWTFLYRFAPDLYHLKGIQIAERVSETVGVDAVPGLGMSLRQVIIRINKTFRDELDQDGVEEDDLIRHRPGQQGPWLVVYQWLWEKKYPRWHSIYMWEIWKQEATNNSEWIQFEEFFPPKFQKIDDNERIFVPTINNYLPINTKLNLKLNLNYQSIAVLNSLWHNPLVIKFRKIKYLTVHKKLK